MADYFQQSLLFCTLAIAGSFAMAGEKVELEEAAARDGLVKILNVRGELEIRGWDESRITVEGELDDLTEDFVFEVEDGRALIEVKLPSHNVSWGDGSDLTIWIPNTSRLDVHVVSSDVNVEDIQGGVRVKAVSGDVELKRVGERILVNGVSSNVETDSTHGALYITTTSGDIEVENHQGGVSVETVSGEVSVDSYDTDLLMVSSVSGDQEIRSKLLQQAQMTLESVSGDVTFDLDSDIDAIFDLRAGGSGELNNHLTDDRPEDGFAGEELKITLGKGVISHVLRTVSGDITIE